MKFLKMVRFTLRLRVHLPETVTEKKVESSPKELVKISWETVQKKNPQRSFLQGPPIYLWNLFTFRTPTVSNWVDRFWIDIK